MTVIRKGKLCQQLKELRIKQNGHLNDLFATYAKPTDNCGAVLQKNSDSFNSLRSEEGKILESLGDHVCEFDQIS